MLGPARVGAGDVIIGIPSPGLRSNGYTLARHVLLERAGRSLGDPAWAGATHTVADELLRPSVIYTPAVLAVRAALSESDADGDGGADGLHACAHITGGGIVGNLPRALPEGLGAVLERTVVGGAADIRRDPAAGIGRGGRDGPCLQSWRRYGARGGGRRRSRRRWPR